MTTKVTIFTPTYNRANLLPKLYNSLCNQTSFDFEWLIIDDGSLDNTEEIVSQWLSNDRFKVRYYTKENGGKHTAINYGAQLAEGELFFIVDSDDSLTPDAIETIISEWNSVKDKNLNGIAFLRGRKTKDGYVANNASVFPEDNVISNIIVQKYNRGVSADNAEVWTTESIRRHPFTIYPGEKFMSEGMVWIRLAKENDMLFRNKVIYICEYLEGGLTKQGKKLRFLCPKGGIEGSLETMSRHFNLKMRIKQTLLYIVYCKFDNWNLFQILRCPYKGLVTLCLPAGYGLYHYWKHKYFEK
ncbi:MAG: glycosyltransferase [Muribaculaceae bacterium]|nr:glycosyltransferase [Muribaculaceae bacterium]